jgi:DNA mismatch repair protein MutS
VRREVTRVITPGTVVEEILLEPHKPNYLASVIADANRIGLAFLDVSTGEFRVTEIEDEQAWDRFEELITQFAPSELLLPRFLEPVLSSLKRKDLLENVTRSILDDWVFSQDYASRLLLEHFKVTVLDGYGLSSKPLPTAAAGAILHYIRDGQKIALNHIGTVIFFTHTDFLRLDPSTVEHLELLKSQDGSRKWTLLATLNFCKTGMGARMLRSWMLAPLQDITAINRRLDAVQELKGAYVIRKELTQILEKITDIERLFGRLTVGTGNARDLSALSESLALLPALHQHLDGLRADFFLELARSWDNLQDIHGFLEQAVADEPPASLNEGGLIRDGYNAELDELRNIRRSGKAFIAALENRERQRTGIQSLKVRYNQVFGYFIEVTKSNLHLIPPDFMRKQTLVNAERFVTPELKEYEEKVLGAEERIFSLEKELFIQIRQSVVDQARRIQAVAQSVAVLDVLQSLSEAAGRYRYCRPRIENSGEIYIKGCRHPVLEHCFDPFIPNDVYLNDTTHQLIILTGPNMGGKSTYLRQIALVVILAQMGSFVPAADASISLTDQLFTRVGASDNLARGRSTFMVEMVETANILNRATPRSLILLDEVGRGTATFDGLSIAWAIAEYIHNQESRRAKTIFATHYHEMIKLPKILPGAKNYCMAVQESAGEILLLHRVMEGSANRSYGIEVARLAGMPQEVWMRAREILARLERRDIDLTSSRKAKAAEDVFQDMQRTLFEP